MMDSYNLILIFVICFSAEKDYDIMLKSKVKEGGQKVNTFERGFDIRVLRAFKQFLCNQNFKNV